MGRLKEVILGLEKPEDIERVIPDRAQINLEPLITLADRSLEEITKELDSKGIVLSDKRVKKPAAILLKLLAKKARDVNLLTDVLAASCYEENINACYERFEQFLQEYALCGRIEDTLLKNGGTQYHALRFLIHSNGKVLQVRIKPEAYRSEDEGDTYVAYKMKGIQDLQHWLKKREERSTRLEQIDEKIMRAWELGKRRIENKEGITLCQALDAYSTAPYNYRKVRCVKLSPRSETLVRAYDSALLDGRKKYA